MVTIIARSVRGLEWVAADEISATLPQASGLAMSSREITFLVPELAPPLLGLRTVDDVFVQVGRVSGLTTSKQAAAIAAPRIADLDWAGALAQLGVIRAIPPHPRLDVVASLEGRRTTLHRRRGILSTGKTLRSPLGQGLLKRKGAGISSWRRSHTDEEAGCEPYIRFCARTKVATEIPSRSSRAFRRQPLFSWRNDHRANDLWQRSVGPAIGEVIETNLPVGSNRRALRFASLNV